ncbi:MAG TPA: protease modulator HflC [Rhizomicrobium sp.]|jgi:membrane protease subunit HflC|nr:protease modulator HflC [Rhizomicrobium sp.]
MNRVFLAVAGVLILACISLAGASFYTVYPTEQVLVLQFGAPLEVVTDEGLHTKIPWMQTIQVIDRRLLNLEAPAEEVITEDKKRIVVDAFARWRIVDPLRFYQTLLDETGAQLRLDPFLSSDLRRVLGSQSFATLLSGARTDLMHDIRDDMNQETGRFGVAVVDVRIRHADLPPQNSQAIFQRMQQERKREANEFRAEGSEIKQRIEARAEREVTVLTAEANREAQILRGEGEAEQTRILGDAFGQDPDFFGFYRSMQAYREALPAETTRILLSPNSEFFHYFGQAPAGASISPSSHRRH